MGEDGFAVGVVGCDVVWYCLLTNIVGRERL